MNDETDTVGRLHTSHTVCLMLTSSPLTVSLIYLNTV